MSVYNARFSLAVLRDVWHMKRKYSSLYIADWPIYGYHENNTKIKRIALPLSTRGYASVEALLNSEIRFCS